MSIKDPDYDDIVEEKKRGSKMKGISIPNFKNAIVPLLVGMAIGIIITIIVAVPYLEGNQSAVCKECLNVKELLNKENDCLYRYIDSPSDALMLCQNQADTLNPPEGLGLDENMPFGDINE